MRVPSWTTGAFMPCPPTMLKGSCQARRAPFRARSCAGVPGTAHALDPSSCERQRAVRSGTSGCLLARLLDGSRTSAPVIQKVNQLLYCSDVQSWPLVEGMRTFLNAPPVDTRRRGRGPESPQVVTMTADSSGFDHGFEGLCALAWRMLLRWRCRDAVSARRPRLPVRLATSVSLPRRAGRILQSQGR